MGQGIGEQGTPLPRGQSVVEPGARRLSLGGIAAALGAGTGCVIPFPLFSLGVSGAWIGNLTALEPYQPIFAAISLGCIAAGARRRRRRPILACAEGDRATPRSDRIARIGLWTAGVLAVAAAALPYIIRALLAS